MVPNIVFAAWPKAAFETEELSSAIKSLYGSDGTESDKINLKAPDIAENGAVVPISVSTDLPNVDNISIYVEGNPNPLSATFELNENSVADVSTRIKMGKTSNVVAVVKSDGKVYTTRKEVKVTIGGCGG
jgi:sulfur-oxidizing protein SoxY